LKAIKSKVPSCQCTAIHINPAGGQSQCLWANEFALASRTIELDTTGKTTSPITYKEPEIENWFLHTAVPTTDEGFSNIIEMPSYLYVNTSTFSTQVTPYKFMVTTSGSYCRFEECHSVSKWIFYYTKT
jgi:hypothetical protein